MRSNNNTAFRIDLHVMFLFTLSIQLVCTSLTTKRLVGSLVHSLFSLPQGSMCPTNEKSLP
ncbi:hypothetical protein BCR37DRAFT_377871 [Protomyces lactucae-debilis]|uniref:Uncharacterized protein n=1 Tax=Protomyces lactucae-debilis TaxID=2754530 RepID=A0A1Y2FLW0_PROLT|nr:uncharacterized protein BCR37DRAFT_377871 [Protomyces lactucae-debilis]ORY84953.1 hypothetical protein BCR37DRAFT_377871 [Protomyces lactucae-debilis]